MWTSYWDPESTKTSFWVFVFGFAAVLPWKGGFPGSLDGKEPACNTGYLGFIPGSGRFPGKENGDPLQYSCLENPMDRGAWQATIHGGCKELDTGHDWVTNTFQEKSSLEGKQRGSFGSQSEKHLLSQWSGKLLCILRKLLGLEMTAQKWDFHFMSY